MRGSVFVLRMILSMRECMMIRPGKLVYLLVFSLIFASLSGCVVYSSGTLPLSGNAPTKKSLLSRSLLITIDGPLVEEVSSNSSLRVDSSSYPVLVRRLITTLEYARNDRSIDLIVLNLSEMQGSTLATAADLFQALQETKKAGKIIYAFSEGYSLSSFLLASVADRIWLDPLGDVEIDGLSADYNFFKRAMDKYGIDAYVARVGQYKSAVEPVTQYTMSEPVRRENTQLLQEQWDYYLSMLKQNKRFENMELDAYTRARPQLLVQAQGDAATLALEQKLIDNVGTWDQFQEVIEQDGHAEMQDYEDYLRQAPANAKQMRTPHTPYVTVVYAVGTITRSGSKGDALNADTLVENLKIASENPKTKALVLRVDSPGGDVFASEMIAREIEKIKEKIPVIVSMAGVAASGGYWISASASEIWAEKSSITGSIGVFSIMLSGDRFLRNHGIDYESIATHPQANNFGGLSLPLPNSTQRTMIQSNVDFVYKLFLNKLVANDRAKDLVHADSLAQGQVYTGERALQLGLVDKVGTLEDALKRAAELADLREYTVVVYSPQQSLWTRIFSLLKNPSDLLAELGGSSLRLPEAYLNKDGAVCALSGFVPVLP